MAAKKKSSQTGKSRSYPVRLDAATMARLAAVQKHWLPPSYGGLHAGPVPTISMADLMRYAMTVGLDRIEEMVGLATKAEKKGGAR